MDQNEVKYESLCACTIIIVWKTLLFRVGADNLDKSVLTD